MRIATISVALTDIFGWAIIAIVAFLSGADVAARDVDRAVGLAATALVLATGVPALSLALPGLAPRFSLILALACPLVGALLLAGTVAAFA